MLAKIAVFALFLAISHAACPKGAMSFNDQNNTLCFYMIKAMGSYPDAEATCVTLGGYLATICDSFTNNFISRKLFFGGENLIFLPKVKNIRKLS